jgi:hypothetical protein
VLPGEQMGLRVCPQITQAAQSAAPSRRRRGTSRTNRRRRRNRLGEHRSDDSECRGQAGSARRGIDVRGSLEWAVRQRARVLMQGPAANGDSGREAGRRQTPDRQSETLARQGPGRRRCLFDGVGVGRGDRPRVSRCFEIRCRRVSKDSGQGLVAEGGEKGGRWEERREG